MIWKSLKLVVQLVLVFLLTTLVAQGQSQKSRTPKGTGFNDTTATQQPLFSDYKGVRIGMTADEAHKRLGKGTRIDEQEFYVINEKETAQLAFDKTNKVVGISVDYLEGVGAPDYRSVVGPEITVKPDGSIHKVVRYEQLGFWVSYSRTTSTAVMMVSITIGKIL